MSDVTTSQANDLETRMARLDNAEALMLANFEPREFLVVHRFTPGLYAREIFMPAGSIITSKIHRTEHPYVISQGRVSVFIEGKGWEQLSAPHTGITKPGTRRLLLIHEDTVWITFHPTELETVEEIEAEIIEPHTNPLLELSEVPGLLEVMG